MKVGVDTSRRVEVKLRPGPKRKMDGELSSAVVHIKQRIAEVAWGLALRGTWPSPKSVGDADEKLTKDNVAHHRDALEAARLKWSELHGPHSHWKAPKPVADEEPAVEGRVVNDPAASVPKPDDGRGATAIGGATTEAGSAASELAPASPSSATAHPRVSNAELEARIVDLEAQVVGFKAALDKEQRRVRRLEEEVGDREVRIATLDETLCNLRDLNARLMLNLRQNLPVYENVGGPPPV